MGPAYREHICEKRASRIFVAFFDRAYLDRSIWRWWWSLTYFNVMLNISDSGFVDVFWFSLLAYSDIMLIWGGGGRYVDLDARGVAILGKPSPLLPISGLPQFMNLQSQIQNKHNHKWKHGIFLILVICRTLNWEIVDHGTPPHIKGCLNNRQSCIMSIFLHRSFLFN